MTYPDDSAFGTLTDGLTKREYLASIAMHGLVIRINERFTEQDCGNASLLIADLLIAALNKEPKP